MNYFPFLKNKLKNTQLQINSFCYNAFTLDSPGDTTLARSRALNRRRLRRPVCESIRVMLMTENKKKSAPQSITQSVPQC